MASNFPTSLDTYTTLVDNVDNIVAAHANDRGDAIENLETKVGVDSSAVATSHDYKFTHLPGQAVALDIGSYEMRALTFQSDQATGTAPFTVASTTVVTNLNADTVDALHIASLVQTSGTQSITGTKTFATLAVSGDLDFNKNEALEMCLEVLTSDPGAPATGQIWFRSDL